MGSDPRTCPERTLRPRLGGRANQGEERLPAHLLRDEVRRSRQVVVELDGGAVGVASRARLQDPLVLRAALAEVSLDRQPRQPIALARLPQRRDLVAPYLHPDGIRRSRVDGEKQRVS